MPSPSVGADFEALNTVILAPVRCTSFDIGGEKRLFQDIADIGGAGTECAGPRHEGLKNVASGHISDSQ